MTIQASLSPAQADPCHAVLMKLRLAEASLRTGTPVRLNLQGINLTEESLFPLVTCEKLKIVEVLVDKMDLRFERIFRQCLYLRMVRDPQNMAVLLIPPAPRAPNCDIIEEECAAKAR